jgi:uncharacterized Fe-S cluster protein YjdI
MAEREIIKEYTNGELTVVWKPKTCIHSGICVESLPEVYDPQGKPWIKAENATTEALKAQISKCPSGALSYYMNKEEKEEKGVSSNETKVVVQANGPLLVHGNLEVTRPDGSTESRTRTTAFCRCGSSGNKPYCDGSHNTIAFKG